jgi:hypothetical protein
MTDWWNTSAPRQEGEPVRAEPAIGWDPEPMPSMPASPPEPPAQQEEPEAQKPDRRKSLLLGAAGAAAVGVLVFTVMPHDGSTPADVPGVSASSSVGDFPPAAGGGPSEGAQDRAEESRAPAPQKPKVVTLSATPSGSGSVGAIVKLTVVNNTDEAVVVMSSMVKGDGRPAVIGEGTLAPGSRRVEPGETATGTVEFATKKAPAQVALVDLSGNVVAASG